MRTSPECMHAGGRVRTSPECMHAGGHMAIQALRAGSAPGDNGLAATLLKREGREPPP